MLMSKEVITSSHGNMWLCPDQLYQGEGLQRWQKRIRGFKEHKNQQFDLIIIDWPLVSPLGTFLSSMGYPLVLMDRSPPADASILASLQWRVWKKAWKMVAKGVFKMGFAVSEGIENTP